MNFDIFAEIDCFENFDIDNLHSSHELPLLQAIKTSESSVQLT